MDGKNRAMFDSEQDSFEIGDNHLVFK